MRNLLVLTGLVMMLMIGAPVRGAAVPPVLPIRQALDVRYHPGNDDRHTLDVFRPDVIDRVGRPVVLFVHGGTWMVGDKDFRGIYRGVGKELARQGVVTVLMNYRLSPLVRHPEHVRDVARASPGPSTASPSTAATRRRIVLAGHSAGGALPTSLLVAIHQQYLAAPELSSPRLADVFAG
ncbi:MAG: alpha/beta hydrolase [Gemmataceae bacterium]